MSETAPQCVGATKVEEGLFFFFFLIKHVKVCDELRSSFGIRVRGFSVLGRTLTVTRYFLVSGVKSYNSYRLVFREVRI